MALFKHRLPALLLNNFQRVCFKHSQNQIKQPLSLTFHHLVSAGCSQPSSILVFCRQPEWFYGQKDCLKYGCSRTFATASQSDDTQKPLDKTSNSDRSSDVDVTSKEQKLSTFQKMKQLYKEHGKVVILVHLVTSAAWFGSFYYIVHLGIDIMPLLEKLFSEKYINPLRNSSLGDVALAYLIYKLASPARYTVTIVGSSLTINFLRKMKWMAPKQEGSFKALVKDTGQQMGKKLKVNERKAIWKQRQLKYKERAALLQSQINKNVRLRFKKGTMLFRSSFEEKRKIMQKKITGKNK